MNPTNSQAALANLQQIQAQSKNPNDILANQRQQLGVNAANDTVTGLRGAINNTTKLLQQVAPSVMGRTGGSLVTDAQANRIIQNEQAPIAQSLSDQGTKYTQATEDLGRLEDQAARAASGIYQGQQDKLSYAQNLYNVLYQKERDAQAAAEAEAARQEQIRQFNETLAADKAKAAASGPSTFNLSGGAAAPQATKAAAPTPQQRSDYALVKNLISQVGAGNGVAASQMIAKARSGDTRAKDIMRAFYQLQDKPIPNNFRSFL